MFKFLAPIALAALASPALAAEPPAPEPAPPVYQAVLDCRAVSEAAARLACFDSSVAAMAAARANKDLVIADRATMREARRGLFGLPLPRLKLFGDGQSEEVTAIDGTIASSYATRDGSLIFVLTDGARWKQIEGRPAYARKGDPIHIQKASLGSYFAKIGKGQNARVIRVD